VTPLVDVRTAKVSRRRTGIGEFDRILGGGLVPGSLVLLGGPPGIGKSTLMLQAADRLATPDFRVLYISGEESPEQVRSRAARIGVENASVIVELADIFAWNIDFLTETRDGDRFALTWKEDRTPDGRLVEVKILGAIYDGKATGHHRATRFMDDYYDEKGVSLRKAFLHAPLNFRRISSGFTNRRFHPILRQWRPHHGTDYAAASGTPVVAVGDGTVISQGLSGGLGNLVKVRHNATYTTYYGHLSRFAKGVGAGTRVRQGQVVGYVGSTGLSTGPHLHFEVLKNGTTVNFLTLKMPAMGSVPEGRMKAFEQKRDQVLPPLEQQLAVLSKN
jgi:murein DD-endopeptidase MepM/ murein hydrolase activator NlpD